jgi:hypothetical protein
MWMRWWVGAVIWAGLAGSVVAQDRAPAAGSGDSWNRTTEVGVRLTPEMARAGARLFTEKYLVSEFELDPAKVDQATELMARRIMQLAHEHEEAGQEFIEFAMTTALEFQVKNRNGAEDTGFPVDLAKGVGTRLVPLIPSIREATNGVMQDVRPLLSFKQQLKFTGQIALANVALDALDKNMRRWSTGEVDEFSDPFDDPEATEKRDAAAEKQRLDNARKAAEARSKQRLGAQWEEYVKAAKEYYQMDDAQGQAADSLLREYQERAKTAIGSEAEWRKRIYANQFWQMFSMELPGKWGGNPLYVMLDRERETLREPLDKLEEELKQRIDEIPTQAQREAAEARITAAFAAKGVKIEEIAGNVAGPNGGTEGGK